MKLTKQAKALLASASAIALFGVACSGGDESKTDDGMGGGGSDFQGPQCEEAGGSQCTGSASGLVCPEGSTNAVEFTCATGEICNDGECVGQCEPGATECAGDSVQRVCTADGRSWVNVPCAEGNVCEDGSCGLEGGLVCTPGEKECEGDTARTCKSDGSGWDEVECPGATECVEGECKGSVCTVGATRCDESTLDMPSRMYFEYPGNDVPFLPATEGQYGVIQRCVDGESWVTEPCSDDPEVEKVCAYDNLDRVETAKYRAEVAVWMNTVVFGNFGCSGDGDGGDGSCEPLPPPPEAPTIPANAHASCYEPQCQMEAMFFETPSASRECGTLEENDETPWKAFNQCDGMMPYAPPLRNTYACSGLTACGEEDPNLGCQAVTCLPEESKCSSGTDYGFCQFNFEYPESSSFSTGMVCADAAACTDSGEAPERQAECGGQPVEQPPI